MPNKTIICLANSRKMSGRCVAGRELVAGKVGAWVRPISARPSHELSEYERHYANGQDPQLRDIIDVPVIGHRAHPFQVENYLIDDNYHWSSAGQATQTQIRACLDTVNGRSWATDSSYNGLNDRIDEQAASALGESLKFVEVQDLAIHVAVEGAAFGNAKRKVRGQFKLGGAEHLLAVTDPIISRQFLLGENGVFKVGQAGLCLSLGEPFSGYAYLLIAGIILPPYI